jgi:hypothetical protein
MTDAKALEVYNSMVLEFGEHLPDLEHHPIQFQYYYRLFKWIKQNEQKDQTASDSGTA